LENKKIFTVFDNIQFSLNVFPGKEPDSLRPHIFAAYHFAYYLAVMEHFNFL